MKKTFDELTFTDDFMFWHVMTARPELCRELTELILDRKIGRMGKIEGQQILEDDSEAKGIRFDVFFEDDENNVYDIEMQPTIDSSLPDRIRYYHAMLTLSLMNKGTDYRELKKAIVIFICIRNPYPNFGLHRYQFTKRCKEMPDLELEDGTMSVILCVEGEADDVSDEIKSFLRYLATKEPDDRFTQKLESEVKRIKQNEEFRRRHMTLLEKMSIERAEGREEGRAEERINTLREQKRAEAAEKELALYKKQFGSLPE